MEVVTCQPRIPVELSKSGQSRIWEYANHIDEEKGNVIDCGRIMPRSGIHNAHLPYSKSRFVEDWMLRMDLLKVQS